MSDAACRVEAFEEPFARESRRFDMLSGIGIYAPIRLNSVGTRSSLAPAHVRVVRCRLHFTWFRHDFQCRAYRRIVPYYIRHFSFYLRNIRFGADIFERHISRCVERCIRVSFQRDRNCKASADNGRKGCRGFRTRKHHKGGDERNTREEERPRSLWVSGAYRNPICR